jgi:hypothetical protein
MMGWLRLPRGRVTRHLATLVLAAAAIPTPAPPQAVVPLSPARSAQGVAPPAVPAEIESLSCGSLTQEATFSRELEPTLTELGLLQQALWQPKPPPLNQTTCLLTSTGGVYCTVLACDYSDPPYQATLAATVTWDTAPLSTLDACSGAFVSVVHILAAGHAWSATASVQYESEVQLMGPSLNVGLIQLQNITEYSEDGEVTLDSHSYGAAAFVTLVGHNDTDALLVGRENFPAELVCKTEDVTGMAFSYAFHFTTLQGYL